MVALVDTIIPPAAINLARAEKITFSNTNTRVELATEMMGIILRAPNIHTCGITLADVIECCFSHPNPDIAELHNERMHKYINPQAWTERDSEVFNEIIENGLTSKNRQLRVLSAVEAIKRLDELYPSQPNPQRQKYQAILNQEGF